MTKLSALLIETSESDNTSSEKGYPQIDEIATTSSSDFETGSGSEAKYLNMLTKEQTLILDVIQHINDPDIQKKYLEQLRQSLEKEPEPQKTELPSTSTNMYDLTAILNRKRLGKKPLGDIQELQSEIKTIKSEIKQLKDKQQKDSDLIQFLVTKLAEESSDSDETKSLEPQSLANIDKVPNDFLYALSQITSRKYIVKVSLVFGKDFQLDTVALFDTGADLSCLKTNIVPIRFQESTTEKLSFANSSKMHIEEKMSEIGLKLFHHLVNHAGNLEMLAWSLRKNNQEWDL